MKTTSSLAALALAIASLAAAPALASTITYQTRGITGAVGPDYAATWAAQGSAISTSTLADFNGTTPGTSSFAHLNVTFNLASAGTTLFQLAPDAGLGGALYLDGTLVDVDSSDLWWNGSWANVGELLTSGNLGLTSGNHVLEGFWAEVCCSGGQGGRFSTDNGAHWQNLTVANLDALGVPEPGSLALLGAGLAALGLRRRKHVA